MDYITDFSFGNFSFGKSVIIKKLHFKYMFLCKKLKKIVFSTLAYFPELKLDIPPFCMYNIVYLQYDKFSKRCSSKSRFNMLVL